MALRHRVVFFRADTCALVLQGGWKLELYSADEELVWKWNSDTQCALS